MIVLLIVLAAIALVAAAITVPFVLRDGYGPIPTVPDHDSRRPTLRA